MRRLEVPVLSSLKFHLRIYQMARCVGGMVREWDEVQPRAMSEAICINVSEPSATPRDAGATSPAGVPPSSSSAAGGGAAAAALKPLTLREFLTARATRLTYDALLHDDLIFLHTPSTLALAALKMALDDARRYGVPHTPTPATSGAAGAAASSKNNDTHEVPNFDMLLKTLCTLTQSAASSSSSSSSSSASSSAASSAAASTASLSLADRIRRLNELVRSIQESITLGATLASSLDARQLKSLERRRRAVADPTRDPRTAAYARKGEAREARREDDRMVRKQKARVRDALVRAMLSAGT